MDNEIRDFINGCDNNRVKALSVLLCISRALSSFDEKLFAVENKNDEKNVFTLFHDSLDCVNQVINIWIGKLYNKEVTINEILELLEESNIIDLLTTFQYKDLTEEFIEKINLILDKIFMNLPIAKNNEIAFYLFLMVRCQKFKKLKSNDKFDLCKKINLFLKLNLKFCLNNLKVKNCIKVIAEEVYELLRNKLNNDLRKPVFEICATITSCYQNLNWIIIKNKERNSFLLLSRLSIIEARISLEGKNYDIFTDSLILVEFTIKFLIENFVEENNLSKQDSFLQFFTNNDLILLIDALKLLIESFVIYLKENLNLLDNEDSNEYFSWIAVLRILCVYLTSENEFLKKDFQSIFDVIVTYLNKTINKVNKDEQLISLTFYTLKSIAQNDPEYQKKIIQFENCEFFNKYLNEFQDI